MIESEGGDDSSLGIRAEVFRETRKPGEEEFVFRAAQVQTFGEACLLGF